MIALNFFLPSVADQILISFCDTRTLCSTYYSRELSHLTSGEVLVLGPMAAQKTPITEKAESAVKKPVFLNKT